MKLMFPVSPAIIADGILNPLGYPGAKESERMKEREKGAIECQDVIVLACPVGKSALKTGCSEMPWKKKKKKRNALDTKEACQATQGD